MYSVNLGRALYIHIGSRFSSTLFIPLHLLLNACEQQIHSLIVYVTDQLIALNPVGRYCNHKCGQIIRTHRRYREGTKRQRS